VKSLARQDVKYYSLSVVATLLLACCNLCGCSLSDDPKAPKGKVVYAIHDIEENSPILEDYVVEKEIIAKEIPKYAITSVQQLDCKAARYAIQIGQIIVADDLKPLKEAKVEIELSEQLQEKLEEKAVAQGKTAESLALEFITSELTTSSQKTKVRSKTQKKASHRRN
jgi:hypothetical protein